MEEKLSTMKHIKDTIDVTLRLPVMARLKKRIKEIQVLSQAKIIKIPMGNTHKFETTAPRMFITDLDGRMDNGVGVISYSKYKMEGPNKAIRNTFKDVVNSKGDTVKVQIDASYIIDKVVIERIEHLKKMNVEVMDYE